LSSRDTNHNLKNEKTAGKVKDIGQKERIALIISTEEKERWQAFSERKGDSTLSRMIRNAVDMYMNIYTNFPGFESFSKISRDLKGPLTAIKGYTHLLIERYKDELNSEIIFTLKDILENSNMLEKKITDLMDVDIENTQGPRCDVLIIDDDATSIKILTNLFELKGLQCKGLMSGRNVVEEIEKIHPKVVLLDIILPEKSGYDICKEVKGNSSTKSTLVYYITAVPGFEVEKMMQETEADGYFTKPFNFTLLDNLISRLKA